MANEVSLRLPADIARDLSGKTICLPTFQDITLQVPTALKKAEKMAPFQALSRRLWEYRVHVTALGRVQARKLTRINREEAMFAGPSHDAGVFCLLSRAASLPELIADRGELQQLLTQWHAEIGHALLDSEVLTTVLAESADDVASLNSALGA
ncbi:MAG: hypothetical protein H6942_09875 [Candidatus Accumulibacter sp.]|uniref:hypothetical protein n=1 Tax=Accumulibacter sp. TaxID=2053492 RepID=UPI0019F8B1B1|nr:hypothetical protein [Accumulibacter sp.]MBE2259331.1 hypothetical protein [Paracoccaceae bacterium]MCB1941109.1 hypothetical protein [Accumulibacter sp.]MCP5248822.1 hypothetical protein [Accumulibacter sp.]